MYIEDVKSGEKVEVEIRLAQLTELPLKKDGWRVMNREYSMSAGWNHRNLPPCTDHRQQNGDQSLRHHA